jgi:hypothetical protein
LCNGEKVKYFHLTADYRKTAIIRLEKKFNEKIAETVKKAAEKATQYN